MLGDTYGKSTRCDSNHCLEAAFRRSSRCDTNACLEAAYRKSSRSDANGNCVEAAHRSGVVLVRDSKQGEHGPVLAFAPADWRVFLRGLGRA